MAKRKILGIRNDGELSKLLKSGIVPQARTLPNIHAALTASVIELIEPNDTAIMTPETINIELKKDDDPQPLPTESETSQSATRVRSQSHQ